MITDSRQSQRLVRQTVVPGRLPPPTPPSLKDVYERNRQAGMSEVLARFDEEQREHNRKFAAWFSQSNEVPVTTTNVGVTSAQLDEAVAKIRAEAMAAVADLEGPPGPSGPAGPAGPAGPGGGDRVDWDQGAPALTWTIPHGRGRQPQVLVEDSQGNRVVAFVSDDNNTTSITFTSPISGRAVLLF